MPWRSVCVSQSQSAREQPWASGLHRRPARSGLQPATKSADPGAATCTISARPAVPFTRPADLPVYHSHARDRPRCCMGLIAGKPCSIALLQSAFARAPHSTVWLRPARTSFAAKKGSAIASGHPNLSPTRDRSAHVIASKRPRPVSPTAPSPPRPYCAGGCDTMTSIGNAMLAV